METEFRIRAFRATDDFETCNKFIAGHRKVLKIFGTENITTNTDDWIYNPSIFVVVVESLDKQKLFGGARVQVADGINPLPIEKATSKLDPKITNVVNFYSQFGTAELSGLWNSKEVAGYGIGSIFPIRAATAIVNQIGINSLFFLCAPATLRFNEWIGSRVLTEIGNSGSFYYPKLDLIATAVVLEDAIALKKAQHREKAKIMHLRENMVSVGQERSPFKNVLLNMHYDLKLNNVSETEFQKIRQTNIKV